MRWVGVVSATLVCLVLLAGSGWALLPNFTKEDLIRQSEGIVLGTVLDTWSSWNADHSSIFTYVKFEVQEQFKGQPAGKEILLQIPGGKVGDITQVTSDVPVLTPGMKAVLHLFTWDSGYLGVYGWEKGALTVIGDAIPDYNMSVEQFRRLVETTTK